MRGGHALAGQRHRQLGTVRAKQGAASAAVHAAIVPQSLGQCLAFLRADRLQCEHGAGKVRVVLRQQRRAEAFDQLAAIGGQYGAMLRQLRLQRVEPARVGRDLVRQQAVAIAQRRFVAIGDGGVAGGGREHQPVDKAPARARAVGEQAVHRGGQPAHR